MSIQTKPLGGTYITFRVGGERFALDIHRVREVLELLPIIKVPMAPPSMRGVVDVRGCSIPVVDLKTKFGLGTTEATPDTRILVLELPVGDALHVVGGLADAVQEVVELDASQIEPPPSIGLKWRSDIFTGIGRRKEGLLLLLDIGRVISADELRSAEGAMSGLVEGGGL